MPKYVYLTIFTEYHPCNDIPYSREYWQELNLVVEPKIAIARILTLVVRYGIAICL